MTRDSETMLRDGRTSARGVYWAVAIVAVVVHAVSILSTPLWVYPDSVDYIELAGGLVQRGDWSNELFLVRPPGYPLLLAGIFELFGQFSPLAIQVLQHALGIATALLTVATALRVTRQAKVALIAGVLCAVSLQILAYCNMPLTEIPFTFTIVGATYYLVRYRQSGSLRLLVVCGLFAGLGYMIKPIGVFFFGPMALVVLVREWAGVYGRVQASPDASTGGVDRRLSCYVRRLAWAACAAGTPVVLVALPWVIQSARTHASNGTSRCLDYVLYFRPVELGRLDSPSTRSAAMRDIWQVVAEAERRGLIKSPADHRDRLTVIQAYERVRGMPFAESSKVLGRAGLDILLENPVTVAVSTVKDAAWLLMAPDPVYRFVPGGAPGIGGQRDKSAELYDVSTYSVGPASWEGTLAGHRAYLPMDQAPRVMTPAWVKVKELFRAHVDRGPSPLTVRDSLYEEFMLFAVLAGVVLVVRRRSLDACIPLLILTLYVGISALLAGSQTRYAVVVKPILFIWAGWGIVACVDVLVLIVRRLAPRRAHPVTAFDDAGALCRNPHPQSP